MKITVIGCGRWGSFIGYYLDSIGHTVTFFGQETSTTFTTLRQARQNSYVTLPDSIQFSSDIQSLLQAEKIVIAIGAQNLRALIQEYHPYFTGQPLILCMKGLEISSGARLSTIVQEELSVNYPCAVWLGPGHPQEFVKGVPNCMVIDSNNETLKYELVNAFSSSLIRFYYGTDLIGSEIGAALKNVIGVAAGMLDGLQLTALKGALLSRGTLEVARLIESCGGKGRSAYGLCHLGDYEATVFSPHSHNRKFGESFVKNESYDLLAEGYYSAKAVYDLANTLGIEMPICSVVYDILYQGKDPLSSLNQLFVRTLKDEFY